MKAYKKIISIAVVTAIMISIVCISSIGVLAYTSRSLSVNGANFIKAFEGCRLTAYKAHESEEYYTIGWGHYGSDVKKGQTITQAKADAMFLEDIKPFENAVNNFAKKHNQNFTQNQFDVLVSFSYNMGTAWMSKTSYSIYKYMSTGKYTINELSDTFTSWVNAGGVELAGLVSRRQAEAALFLTPDTTKYEFWEVTASGFLRLRKSTTTSSTVLAEIPNSAKIIVTETKTANGYNWGKVRYYNRDTGESQVGWAALNYAKKRFSYTTATTTTTTKKTTTTTQKPTTTYPANAVFPFDNENIGDANNDTKVNMADTLILRKYLAKWDIELLRLTPETQTTLESSADQSLTQNLSITASKTDVTQPTADTTKSTTALSKSIVLSDNDKSTTSNTTIINSEASTIDTTASTSAIDYEDTLTDLTTTAKVRQIMIFENADINSDNKINMADVLFLRKHLARIVVWYTKS